MAQVDGEVAVRDPNVLMKEIERTRADLARTIDQLAERVSPQHLAQQARERVREEVNRPQARLVGGVVVLATVALVGFALWRRHK
jgi:Protein of unknown function (DUF3618)